MSPPRRTSSPGETHSSSPLLGFTLIFAGSMTVAAQPKQSTATPANVSTNEAQVETEAERLFLRIMSGLSNWRVHFSVKARARSPPSPSRDPCSIKRKISKDRELYWMAEVRGLIREVTIVLRHSQPAQSPRLDRQSLPRDAVDRDRWPGGAGPHRRCGVRRASAR